LGTTPTTRLWQPRPHRSSRHPPHRKWNRLPPSPPRRPAHPPHPCLSRRKKRTLPARNSASPPGPRPGQRVIFPPTGTSTARLPARQGA
jgi:hypothetical protein